MNCSSRKRQKFQEVLKSGLRTLDDITVSKSFFFCARYVPSETFIKSFQFKILNDILFTNHRLAEIGCVPSDLCAFCESESETINHLFYECSFDDSLIWAYPD